MRGKKHLVNLNNWHLPRSIGNKATNLRKLQEKGFQIPETLVCTWEAHHRYWANDASLIDELRVELVRRLNPTKHYAVRSSADIEDGFEQSFAGQFKSALDVRGVDEVLAAIWSVWANATSPALQTYLERQGNRNRQVSMAVIIQEMVPAVAAGVALSRNPVTGAHEIVIEAVSGRGDTLVQAGVTPHRWVRQGDHWLSHPEGDPIPLSLVECMVQQIRLIEKAFQSPVDLEWAWDGKELYWLQARRITALNRHSLYSNHMAKEMLPGMIKPLVWSVNIPMKSVAFVRFLNEMLGETGIQPEDLVKAFYYRVYFNMGVIGEAFAKLGLPADSVEMMSGMVPMAGRKMIRPNVRILKRLPRMLAMVHSQWQFHNKMRRALPGLEQQVRSFQWQEAGQLSVRDLLETIDRLFPLVQEIAYANILCPILAVMHNAMFERELKRLGLSSNQLDLTKDLPELYDFDPTAQIHALHTILSRLDPQQQQALRNFNYQEMLEMPGIDQFQAGLVQFIERFGHLSDNSNDFTCSPWRENPDLVLRLVLDTEPAQTVKTDKFAFADVKVSPLRRPMMTAFYHRVRQYRLLREQLSMLYSYSYGLFRSYYLALGNHLVNTAALEMPEDIFYLTDNQVRGVLSGTQSVAGCRAEVARQKSEMEQCREISLPTVIYGDREPPIIHPSSQVLTGVATSIGHYTGPVKIVRGIQDFNKVDNGDVLVIPYSDVGWSPLFARAGAVVAESGGLLSHSSIIAREYGIPAVVSVNGAMDLLADLRKVTVDGHKGVVLVHAA